MRNISVILYLLIIYLLHCAVFGDIFDDGRQKYDQLLSLSSTTTSPCWQKVLTMLHQHCSRDDLEKYQSFIAYQFTICHLSTMNNDQSFSLCNEKNVHQCIEQLHHHINAFIAYTEFYPFVQSVCYVLREKSFQSELSTRLMMFLSNSEETIKKLTSSIDIQQKLTDQLHRQQSVQEIILSNAIQLKQLARTNMDKTQNILSNVIQAARHEYDLLKQICSLSQTIQTIVRITCTYSFWFYVLSMFGIYIVTIPKRTSRARTFLFCGMFVYALVERYYQMSSMTNFYQCRLICWICCFLILIRFALKYQSRAEINNEQLSRIKADLFHTEETFHRVSRELKRAQSKSRSRSRSLRSRQRQQQTEERVRSPLIADVPFQPLPALIYNENKENIPQTNHLLDDDDEDQFLIHTKSTRHYSLILSRPSKSRRILLGRKNFDNNL